MEIEDMLSPLEIRKLAFMTIYARKEEGASPEEIDKVIAWAAGTKAMEATLELILSGKVSVDYDPEADDVRFHLIPEEELPKVMSELQKLEG